MLRERSENKQVFPPPPDSRNSAAASRGYSLSNEFATAPQDYLYIVVDPRVHKSTLRRNVPPGIISLRERRRRRREPRRHAAPRRPGWRRKVFHAEPRTETSLDAILAPTNRENCHVYEYPSPDDLYSRSREIVRFDKLYRLENRDE